MERRSSQSFKASLAFPEKWVCIRWPNSLIMTAHVTNFLAHKDISYIFEMTNLQLERINQWFVSDKLLLNISKTKYLTFSQNEQKRRNSALLPKLNINNSEIERPECLKFLGVLLDQNLCWKEHIKYIESKIAKTTGVLYKAKPYIDKPFRLSLYHCYIHSYVNYGNIAWESTIRTNLKKYTVNRNMLTAKGFHLIRERTLNHLIIWLNGWVFVYELSGWEFESRCCQLNVRYNACFEQALPWYSDKL